MNTKVKLVGKQLIKFVPASLSHWGIFMHEYAECKPYWNKDYWETWSLVNVRPLTAEEINE